MSKVLYVRIPDALHEQLHARLDGKTLSRLVADLLTEAIEGETAREEARRSLELAKDYHQAYEYPDALNWVIEAVDVLVRGPAT